MKADSISPPRFESENLLNKFFLPSEVLLMIFRDLTKQDLKSVRLSCKTFCDLVTGLLFDRVFVSPYNKDLDVFAEISRRPHLCRSVKIVIYGVERFDMSVDNRRLYLSQLITELSEIFKLEELRGTITLPHHDPEVEKLFAYIRECRRSMGEVKKADHETWVSSRIVHRGYDMYRELVEEQQANLQGEMASYLCVGLEKLFNVRIVKFASAWSGQHGFEDRVNCQPLNYRRLSGSPLARSWHPLFLGSELREKCSPVEFTSIIRALALTGRMIRTLHCRHGVLDYTFDPTTLEGSSLLRHASKALQQLSDLRLRLHPQRGLCQLDILPRILRSITNLRTLKVNGIQPSDGEPLRKLIDVFGSSPHRWPQLEMLTLQWFKCSESELLVFLTAQPKLIYLMFQGVELTSGDWKDVIDKLQACLELEAFRLQWPIRDIAGLSIFDDTNGGLDLKEHIEHYVLHGGRNPLIDNNSGRLITSFVSNGED